MMGSILCRLGRHQWYWRQQRGGIREIGICRRCNYRRARFMPWMADELDRYFDAYNRAHRRRNADG